MIPEEINLKLPEWARQKSMIFIIAGNEVVARYKFHDIGWEIKTQRCSQCGQCCLESGEDWFAYDPEKGCKFLEYEIDPDGQRVYRCSDPDQPWHCVRGSGGGRNKCTVRFERI